MTTTTPFTQNSLQSHLAQLFGGDLVGNDRKSAEALHEAALWSVGIDPYGSALRIGGNLGSASVVVCAVVCLAWRTTQDGSIDFGAGGGFAVGAAIGVSPMTVDPTDENEQTLEGSILFFGGSCLHDSSGVLSCLPSVSASSKKGPLVGVYIIQWDRNGGRAVPPPRM